MKANKVSTGENWNINPVGEMKKGIVFRTGSTCDIWIIYKKKLQKMQLWNSYGDDKSLG